MVKITMRAEMHRPTGYGKLSCCLRWTLDHLIHFYLKCDKCRKRFWYQELTLMPNDSNNASMSWKVSFDWSLSKTHLNYSHKLVKKIVKVRSIAYLHFNTSPWQTNVPLSMIIKQHNYWRKKKNLHFFFWCCYN